MKVCIIVSQFYPKISKMLVNGTLNKLRKNNIKDYKILEVSGTLEIPVIVSALINKYEAFIVLGCVIKGETSHFDFLCSSVFYSITSLSVNYKKPIGNGILTCDTKKQASKRANPKEGDKGGDAAKAIISLLNILN